MRIVESIVQATLPATETIVAGAPVRIDTGGKFANGNATTPTEASIYGIATHSCIAGEALTAPRIGVLDGYDLTSQAYGLAIYLSDTDARIADSVGTESLQVGMVIPGWANQLGVAADKLLHVDCRPVSAPISPMYTISWPLLAGSVDSHIFVAPGPCTLEAVDFVVSVAGSTGAAVRPRKITDASAPGATAGATVIEMTGALDLESAVANTVTAGTVVTAGKVNEFDTGDKLALDFAGTLTNLVGVITLTFSGL